MHITDEVSKILKTVQRDIIFILNVLSIVLAKKNVVSYI